MGCINGRKVVVGVHSGMCFNMFAFDYPGTPCVFATVVYLRRPHTCSLNIFVKPCNEELSDLWWRNYYCELCCVQAELNNNTKTLMVERLSAILSAVTFCSRVHSVTYMYMYVHARRLCTCGHGMHVVNLCNETRDRQVAILPDLILPVVHLTSSYFGTEKTMLHFKVHDAIFAKFCRK